MTRSVSRFDRAQIWNALAARNPDNPVFSKIAKDIVDTENIIRVQEANAAEFIAMKNYQSRPRRKQKAGVR